MLFGWTQLVFKMRGLISDVRASGMPLSKKIAERIADAALDVLEEEALTTKTHLDDRFLAWARARLKIPEFESHTPVMPEPTSPIKEEADPMIWGEG